MKHIFITKENVEEIIAKQMDGLSTAEEDTALMEWRSESKGNEEDYELILRLNGFFSDMESSTVDVDRAWANVKLKIKTSSQRSKDDQVEMQSKAIRYRYFGAAAAVLVIVFAFGLFRSFSSDPLTLSTDSAIVHSLDDVSVIH